MHIETGRVDPAPPAQQPGCGCPSQRRCRAAAHPGSDASQEARRWQGEEGKGTGRGSCWLPAPAQGLWSREPAHPPISHARRRCAPRSRDTDTARRAGPWRLRGIRPAPAGGSGGPSAGAVRYTPAVWTLAGHYTLARRIEKKSPRQAWEKAGGRCEISVSR